MRGSPDLLDFREPGGNRLKALPPSLCAEFRNLYKCIPRTKVTRPACLVR